MSHHFEASFLKASSCLRGKFVPTQQWCLRSSWRLGAKLAPRREVGAYASFKKLPSGALELCL
jgi:hypothetical protein